MTTNNTARISHKETMKNLAIPAQPFTVAALAELNSIPNSYANKWIKENAVEAGKVGKPAGQRGRSAGLFNIKPAV